MGLLPQDGGSIKNVLPHARVQLVPDDAGGRSRLTQLHLDHAGLVWLRSCSTASTIALVGASGPRTPCPATLVAPAQGAEDVGCSTVGQRLRYEVVRVHARADGNDARRDVVARRSPRGAARHAVAGVAARDDKGTDHAGEKDSRGARPQRTGRVIVRSWTTRHSDDNLLAQAGGNSARSGSEPRRARGRFVELRSGVNRRSRRSRDKVAITPRRAWRPRFMPASFVYQKRTKVRDGADICEIKCKRLACEIQVCISRASRSRNPR